MVSSLYVRYWAKVHELLGTNVSAKTTALRLNTLPPDRWDANAAVAQLYDAFQHPAWLSPAHPSNDNWIWRRANKHDAVESHEVRLERAVVHVGTPHLWTYQMSTASGHLGPNSDKRRSIDLVCRSGAGGYRFIELKIGINHPLYAAFEILGYGLAYLHARVNADPNRSAAPDVLIAKTIALDVLAPVAWYQHRGLANDFELTWLVSGLNQGLASLLAAQGPVGLESMTFTFGSFLTRGVARKAQWTDDDYRTAAAAIVARYAAA